MDLDLLKYPIGKFEKPILITDTILKEWINDLENFPTQLNELVIYLNEEQLNTCYRPNGWTIRQVVHHCADSHMNSIIRFKLALTETNPIIKPYEEQLWAELADGKIFPIEAPLNIISGVHTKLVALLKSLTATELKKTFVHPSSQKTFTIEENIGLYAWHSKHHLAHISNTIKNNNW